MRNKKSEVDVKRIVEAYNRYVDSMASPRRKHESPEDKVFDQYLKLSWAIHSAFISENGYIIPTGNFENVNTELLSQLIVRISKHPRIWKKYFMLG